MQYPIIDLITDAYLNNGWTGLDLNVNPNNIIIGKIDNCNIVPEGVLVEVPGFTVYIAQIESGLPYTKNTYDYIYGLFSTYPTYNSVAYDNTRHVEYGQYTKTFTFTGYIALRTDPNQQIQFVQGTSLPPYEPYKTTTDIFSRLKLPLPHYFPHPVIDALQRAAAGTQTADDTEILRHYLTPLGIGGI